MPQLDPVPWLYYFLMTWFIFVSLAPQKILAHINLNKLSTNKAKMSPRQAWAWTWQ
uniref:ATP synthase complex subunit 8 n=1 Tax=Odorrana schmackeri TaxID=110116 RepID=A0A0K0K9R2_ODOSH|nr:ATP synthase F0 subunit 8 [Odorrana schmackeri]AHN13446.1 ATP synthase F0 subunit 8 [Odorrana schmackeri]AKN10616.1 ATPase subunit 8 [Odorrana schmackeri]ARO35562.1 ATP synthase F0 subunit 8 [Odorrana schmackeri]